MPNWIIGALFGLGLVVLAIVMAAAMTALGHFVHPAAPFAVISLLVVIMFAVAFHLGG